ncbi:uncharacterized protein LOC113131414 isoform X1 [Mastacembelus armatus]|uniref:uncharacterized protein LOC113131414 isoform X1 n=1 Tax=Mastacembelus armatus TaxID=205130 RepID=UPI000E45F066|nr:uncharacterized protein LOC113131414 isoform X1 [Mastacembelus armatus]XP_026164384.1 uncharacterized protein LOC113131414 isoform X1 [Mastacembelus armatus]
MEHAAEDNPGWSMERRVEGLVNKHMEDIALESLQQRLTAVSDEMQNLVEQVSRRSGEELIDEQRRGDVSFVVGPQLCTACSSRAADRFTSISPTEMSAQRKIIAFLVEIKEEQQRQWVVLRDLQVRLQGHSSYKEEDVEALDMDLPLKMLEQLDELERCLEDPGIQKRMVSYLSQMGGATVGDAVRRLMQAVLSFAVGSELNWVGRGQKRSFRNTRLQGILFSDHLTSTNFTRQSCSDQTESGEMRQTDSRPAAQDFRECLRLSWKPASRLQSDQSTAERTKPQ